jgi:hypothetical protein
MGLQSHGSSNFGNFRIPTWESRDKMTFGCWPRGQTQRILKGGRWWLPSSPGHGESCGSMFAHGLSMHQKCFTYALTNLLFGLCKSVWVIDPLVACFGPHLGTPAHPSTPEVLWIRNVPQLFILPLFSHLDSQLSLSRSLGVCQLNTPCNNS